MTAKQKLLACALLGLMVAGIVVLIIKNYGFGGGAIIAVLFVILFFVLCLSLFRV